LQAAFDDAARARIYLPALIRGIVDEVGDCAFDKWSELDRAHPRSRYDPVLTPD